MARNQKVVRPTKKIEYDVVFASASAERGWTALLGTTRGPLVDTWDFLTRTPLEQTPTNYPLKGKLGTVMRGGVAHTRWQHKPTVGGDARIWFYVEGQTVRLEEVHTKHPNATK
jgi:hypothetical protein